MDQRTFESLPLEQRKALQQKLIDAGIYAGKPDGKWGAGTRAAFDQETKRAAAEAKAAEDAAARKRADDLEAKRLDIEATKAQSGKAVSDAEAEAARLETARKQRYQEDASSGLGMATRSAANLAAPAAGTALGMALGKGVNEAMDASQESKNRVLAAAAQDRLAGITTRDGAREGVRLAGAMPINNTAARTMSRMAPHFGLGALSMGKGMQVLHDADPEGEFFPYQADRAAGLGYIGTGAGLAKQGLRYAFSPGVAPDARSIAIINSNQLRRNGEPGALARALAGETADPASPQPRPAIAAPAAPEAAPEASAPAPGSKAHMQSQARDLGIKGVSRMTKSELADALSQAMARNAGRRVRAPKLPSGSGPAAIAGGLAYALTPDDANAATGEPTSNTAEALTNAGVAGGTAYGVSRLAEMLSPAAKSALGTLGEASAPAMIDEMTNYSPDDLAMGRNMLARNLPRALQFGAVEDAYQMAQVPERNPRSQLARMLLGGQ